MRNSNRSRSVCPGGVGSFAVVAIVSGVAGAAGCVAGCGGLISKESRARDAAQELALNARFGRSQIVIQSVAAKERKEFEKTHKAWGGDVRITDAELTGFHMTGDEDAEAVVTIAWFRVNEGEARTTVLRQGWHDNKGSWQLASEERADGDLGLLGEAVDLPKRTVGSAEAPEHPQFPTIRIGESD